MKALFKSLFRLLDDLIPRVMDDLVKHLDTMWDVLGLFGPIVALVGIAGVVVLAMHFHVPLEKRLPGMRSSAELDVETEPTLVIIPHLQGLRRLFKPKNRPLLIRLDAAGLRIERKATVLALSWDKVSRWSREGVADWKLELPNGKFTVCLTGKDGLTEEDLERIDNRLALHVTERPEMTSDVSLKEFAVKARANLERLHMRLPRALRESMSRARNSESPAAVDKSYRADEGNRVE